jgi:transcriptional regulator with XRE-family HTH domain
MQDCITVITRQLPPQMSWTTEWMRNWLSAGKKLRRTQIELAALAELGPANVSRWLSQQTKPDQESIEMIAAKLEPAEAQAWLHDHVPLAARHLVEVRPVGNKPLEGPPPEKAFPEGMSTELKERLIFFGQMAMASPEVRQILNVCYDAAQRALPVAPESINLELGDAEEME